MVPPPTDVPETPVAERPSLSAISVGGGMGKNLLLFFLKIYRIFSPSLRLLLPLNFSCIHFPSCSIYMEESIQRFGAVKGVAVGLKRICSCHSFYG